MVSPEYLASPMAMLTNTQAFAEKQHIARIVLGWSADQDDPTKFDLVQLEFYGDDKQRLGDIDTPMKSVDKTEELILMAKQHVVGVKISKSDEHFRTI